MLRRLGLVALLAAAAALGGSTDAPSRHTGTVTGDVTSSGRAVAEVQVTLASTDPDVPERTVRTNRSGAYAFDNVPAGAYRLTFAHPLHDSPRPAAVRVGPNEQKRVDTIDLERLADVEVFVTPPVDPFGRPWRLAVRSAVTSQGHYEDVRKGETEPSGRWRPDPIAPGSYKVVAGTADGAQLLVTEVEIEGDTVLPLTVSAIPVEGSLTTGGEPLGGAQITFSSDNWRVLRVRTDESGRFRGFVERAGDDWRANITLAKGGQRLVDAISIRPSPATGVAKLDLELPNGIVRGKVVDSRGEAVVASVTIFEEAGIGAGTRTEADGSFELNGLEPGQRQIAAMAGDAQGKRVPVEIDEDEPVTVTLVVEPPLRVTGVVLDAAGLPVPGAFVRYRVRSGEVGRVETGLRGDFELKLPRGVEPPQLTIAARSLPRRVLHVPPSALAGEPLRIVLPAAAGELQFRFEKIPPYPWISRDGATFFAIGDFYAPRAGGPPLEMNEGIRLEMEPGPYVVCPRPVASQRCVTHVLQAGRKTVVELRGFFEEGP